MRKDHPVHDSRHNRYLLGAAAAMAVVVVVAIGSLFAFRPRDHEASLRSSNGYVDSAVCATCHEDIAETYSQTGMGRSFRRMTSQTADANFKSSNTLSHNLSGKIYTMVEQNQAFFERRQMNGFNGGQTDVYERRIDYVIGSGNHARTYLHRTPEGKLIELPVSWYTERGGYWAMSPGYDQAAQMDFRRPIGKECMFCHNAYPESDPSPSNLSDGAVFPANLPEGIDCQRCHGPGANHVRVAQDTDSDPAVIRAAIINPAHLSRDRQLDTCRQCHLETTSLPLPNSIRKYDRAAYSFKPGESLTDYAVYFDHKPGAGFDDRFEVAHQAYRLAKSKCFLNSEMTCTTCHDPHNAPRGEEAVKHYVAVCEGCHRSPHPKVQGGPAAHEQSNCLSCHMWKRRTEDAVHVVMTDHYIQRTKPKSDQLAALKENIPAYNDEVVPYYPKLLSAMPDGQLYYAVAQTAETSNSKSGVARLQHDLEQEKPQLAGFYFALATSYAKLGDDIDAVRWFDRTLQYPDHVPATLREFAAALARSNQLPRALQLAEQATAAEPRDTLALTNLGNIYLQMGRTEDAQRTLEHALAIDPDLSDASNLLGLTRLKTNNTEEAEKMFRRAVLIDPDSVEAQRNLATLLAARGDLQQAEFHMRRAIEVAPDSADNHFSYARILAADRRFDEAIDQMKEAIRLRPQSADSDTVLGDLLVASGHIDAAKPLYMHAIQLDTNQARAHVGLASILMAQNKLPQAEEEYRLAVAADPRNGEAHLALADLAYRRGALSEVRHQLELAAESNDPAARDTARQALHR